MPFYQELHKRVLVPDVSSGKTLNCVSITINHRLIMRTVYDYVDLFQMKLQ
jgi:hypothetical protein